VLDNLREGVLVHDIYDPTLNPLYRDVLAHYGVVALPCRIKDPHLGKNSHRVGRRISAGIVLPVQPEPGRVPSWLSQDRSWWLQAGGLSLNPEHTT